MKLSVKAFALAAAIVWGAAVLLVGLANQAWPTYAVHFLQLLDSVYPGYHQERTLASVFVATGYALVDGLIGGLVFSWLYNLAACPGKTANNPQS